MWMRTCRSFLPVDPAFDLEGKHPDLQPGAALPAVVSQVQERGFLMLKGHGICRLQADWHPVQAGDVIRAGPACPFWFAAIGKVPASPDLFCGSQPRSHVKQPDNEVKSHRARRTHMNVPVPKKRDQAPEGAVAI